MQKLAKNETQKDKVKLLLEYVNYRNFTEVPDPYYGTKKDFEFVYNMLDEATETLLKTLKN